MKIRGLLVAALLLVGLSGLVYWSNQVEKAKENEPAPDAPPKIIDVKEDDVSRIEIRKTGEAPVILEKGEDDVWKITAPESWSADDSAVSSLVKTVADLDSNRLVEESTTELAAYGLDKPQLEVIAGRKDGEDLKLLVGDETPTGSNFFVKLEGDNRIFTLASWNKTSLEKTAWDLRDKRLLTFDSEKLSRVELMAKGDTVEIGKNAQNEWQIVKPKPLRADGGNVEQVISRLRDAKMDSTMTAKDLKEAPSRFAKAARVAVAKVTDAAGTQEIEIRKTSDDQYYAQSSVVEGAYKVTSTIGEGLDKGLDDLRNKKLFDFGYSDPSRIEISDAGAKAVYEKSEDKWMKDGREMDSVTVRALIDELRDLSAETFPETGFTEPVFEATVVSDDGARVEKVLISKSGDAYIAKRDGEPALYGVKALDFDRLQSVAGDVKEPTEKESGDKEQKS